jgi:hypothetical protein
VSGGIQAVLATVAVCTAAGAFLVWCSSRYYAKLRKHGRSAAGLGAVLGLLFGMFWALRPTPPPTTQQAFVDRVLDMPGVDPTWKEREPLAQNLYVNPIARSGMVLLDESQLRERAAQLEKFLSSTGEGTCASFMDEQVDKDVKLVPAVRKWPRAERVDFYARRLVAVERAFEDEPEKYLRRIDKKEYRAAVRDFVDRLENEDDGQRLRENLFADADELDQAERCWTARTLYRALARDSSATAGVVARFNI